jgi:hypothetical protein
MTLHDLRPNIRYVSLNTGTPSRNASYLRRRQNSIHALYCTALMKSRFLKTSRSGSKGALHASRHLMRTHCRDGHCGDPRARDRKAFSTSTQRRTTRKFIWWLAPNDAPSRRLRPHSTAAANPSGNLDIELKLDPYLRKNTSTPPYATHGASHHQRTPITARRATSKDAVLPPRARAFPPQRLWPNPEVRTLIDRRATPVTVTRLRTDGNHSVPQRSQNWNGDRAAVSYEFTFFVCTAHALLTVFAVVDAAPPSLRTYRLTLWRLSAIFRHP